MTTRTEKTGAAGLLVTPFVVVTDTREQAPYTFASVRADAVAGRRPLLVRTVSRALPAGDYSIDGWESRMAVERKSCNDLFGTLGQARARFIRELHRLNALEWAAVVVEAEWSEILLRPPARSRLLPKTVLRSVLAWQQRFPRIHWLMLPGRAVAEVVTFRVLERYYKDKIQGKYPCSP